ncbi:nSTAND1 domain-containing NTPase [Streptomyces hypolithicus]
MCHRGRGGGDGGRPSVVARLPRGLADGVRPLLATGRLVLLVDQFEEAFTLCADEAERRAYIAALAALASPAKGVGDRPAPAVVVLGVRADFTGRCLDHPDLAAVFSHGLFALGPMTGDEPLPATLG